MDVILRKRAEEFARELAGGMSTVGDLRSVLETPTKTMIERMLDAEMDAHLGRVNRRCTSHRASCVRSRRVSCQPS